MKKTKFFSLLMIAVVIAVTYFGFSSCSKDKEPEQDYSHVIMDHKYYNIRNNIGGYDTRYFIQFKTDGTYTWANEDETVNGIYKILASKDTTVHFTGIPLERIMQKMLASGSEVFDNLWVYHVYAADQPISVQAYLGNELVKDREVFHRWDY